MEIVDADGHVNDIADQEAIAKYMPAGSVFRHCSRQNSCGVAQLSKHAIGSEVTLTEMTVIVSVKLAVIPDEHEHDTRTRIVDLPHA